MTDSRDVDRCCIDDSYQLIIQASRGDFDDRAQVLFKMLHFRLHCNPIFIQIGKLTLDLSIWSQESKRLLKHPGLLLHGTKDHTPSCQSSFQKFCRSWPWAWKMISRPHLLWRFLTPDNWWNIFPNRCVPTSTPLHLNQKKSLGPSR